MIKKTLLLLLLSLILNAGDLITQDIIDRAEKKYGIFAKNRFIYINKLIKKLKNSSTIIKLNHINTQINLIKYSSDIKTYGKEDYWATPYEFIGKNKGDCEDYVITKYYILKELGVDPHRMRFLYVIYQTKQGKRENHMVLAYLKSKNPKSRDDYLILDNNNRLILPASKRKDIIRIVGMMNGDIGSKLKKWKQLEIYIQRKKL